MLPFCCPTKPCEQNSPSINSAMDQAVLRSGVSQHLRESRSQSSYCFKNLCLHFLLHCLLHLFKGVERLSRVYNSANMNVAISSAASFFAFNDNFICDLFLCLLNWICALSQRFYLQPVMSKCGEKNRNNLWKEKFFWILHPASTCVSSICVLQPGFLTVYFRYICWPSIHTSINFTDVVLELTYLVY